MKNVMKRLVSMSLMLAMMASMLVCSPVCTQAKTVKQYPTAYCFLRKSDIIWARIAEDINYIVKIESSNSRVVEAYSRSYRTTGPGKCTLTYTLKKKGKTYKAKQNYVVFNKSPIKKVVLNGKNVTKRINTTVGVTGVDGITGTNTISWELAPGYTICKSDPKQIYQIQSSGEITVKKNKGSMKFKVNEKKVPHFSFYVKDKKGRFMGEFKFSVYNPES